MTPIEQSELTSALKYRLIEIYGVEENELESLRVAIIKDFVNGLEPCCYLGLNSFTENGVTSGDHVFSKETKIHTDVGIFDLSQWRDK